MEYIQEITLDLNPRMATPIIYAKQGDADTRVLEIHLMEDGNEYIPEAGSIVMFRARKPDGTYIVDYTSASLNNNIVNVRLTEQALAEAGRALVDIVLYDGNAQYLSTASFILVIQPSPAAAMRGVVSSNEYNVFESLLASVGPAVTSVQAGVSSAWAAANSAWSAVNAINDQGVIITTSNVLEPGYSTPSIIVKDSTNNFYFHAPTVKPYVTATVSLIQDAEPQVSVVSVTPSPDPEEDPNLVAGFNFGFILPKNSLDVSVTSLFDADHFQEAADASYVGAALSGIVDAIPSEIYGSAEYIIPMSHGGTGATSSSAALAALGGQAAIQNQDITLQSTAWSSEGGYWYQTAKIDADTNLIVTPYFIASPNDMSSWEIAADVTLGPPARQNDGTLKFQCADQPSAGINVTVYWW